MKKIARILFVTLILICLCFNVSAYNFTMENSYSVELPDDFTQVGVGKFIGKDDSNFNISVTEKDDKKYCIDNFTEEELLKDAQEEAKQATAAFAVLGKKGGTEVVSCKKVEHPDGKIALVTVYKTFMEKDGEEVSHLQKTYYFSCENNDYSFIFTPDNDKDIDALDETFNSIKIVEPDARSTKTKLVDMIVPMVIILLFILGIIRFIRTPDKRKNGKI